MNEESLRLQEWLEKGAFPALDLGYVDRILFSVLDDHPSRYAIFFHAAPPKAKVTLNIYPKKSHGTYTGKLLVQGHVQGQNPGDAANKQRQRQRRLDGAFFILSSLSNSLLQISIFLFDDVKKTMQAHAQVQSGITRHEVNKMMQHMIKVSQKRTSFLAFHEKEKAHSESEEESNWLS